MVAEGDLESISIPFTAGVASAALFSTWASGGMAASIALSVAAILLIKSMRGTDRDRLTIMSIFLCLGVFCYESAFISAGLPVHTFSFRAAERLKSAIDAVPMSNPECKGLLKALLTGDRSGLTHETVQTFRDAGAAHILALSGMHIGIIYMLLARLTAILGNSPRVRKARSTVMIAAAAFYTMMTGARPSMTRAFLFILISEAGHMMPERTVSMRKTLQAALVIQLVLNPHVITDIGFQLSYLAVCGIAFIMPRLQEWYPASKKISPLKKVWDMTAMSISCQCFTVPLVWARFHSFPQYFLITNLTALPLTTAGITSGLACIALGSHCPRIAAHLCESILECMLKILGVIASI